ncbi:hypothetical protein BDR22DRAFT_316536 [Usnea florida]
MGSWGGISTGLLGILRGLVSEYERVVVVWRGAGGKDGNSFVALQIGMFECRFSLVFVVPNTVCLLHLFSSLFKIVVFTQIEHILSTDSKNLIGRLCLVCHGNIRIYAIELPTYRRQARERRLL